MQFRHESKEAGVITRGEVVKQSPLSELRGLRSRWTDQEGDFIGYNWTQISCEGDGEELIILEKPRR